MGESVRIQDGYPSLDYKALLTSPLSWSIVVLIVVAVLYISSVFLTWYAQKAGDYKASELTCKYALIWAVSLMASALGIIIELKSVGSWHYDQMIDMIWLFFYLVLSF